MSQDPDSKERAELRGAAAGAAEADPVAALFPDRQARERIDAALGRSLYDAQERVAGGSVVPTFDLRQFHEELARFDFERARPVDELIAWALAQLECGVVHMNHPRYFGLFNPAATFPAQCADRIAGAMNPQLATWTTSPAAVDIEAHMIAALARRAGMPAATRGHFTACGSEANFTAVVCALTNANDRFGAEGAAAFGAPVGVYASADCHLAWAKIAHQAGIGRAAVRLVATDGNGRMSMPALREAIGADRAAGRVPVMIVATAGTTIAGMIDPLEECAEAAAAEGLWYHVDAAWGGAAMASPRTAWRLRGMERADSVTIDAHKWFATTMGCGMFLTRRPHVLNASFQVPGKAYMPSNLGAVDPFVNSVQWSRRFLGLRLFLSLGAAGWAGYAVHVERSIELVERLRRELEARGWRIANEPLLAVLCVRPPAGSCEPETLAARVLASGRAWVATGVFEGRKVVRICLTHGETRATDIQELVSALEDCRAA
jgi:glutamate/tyrosine decarboxylase-like PLP-dependent enzyme